MHSSRFVILLALALTACVRTPPPPAFVAIALPPAPTPRPERPYGLPETLALPPLGVDGRYVTINSGLSPAATIWHVRSALNVAALGCRGAEGDAIIADYDKLLSGQKAALTAADTAYKTEFRAVDPADWQAAHDRTLTRTYHFFAQPLAHGRFCIEAAAVAHEIDEVPALALPTFAKLALIRLEAPFTDSYRTYADWQARLTAWTTGVPLPAPRLAYAPFETVIAWAPRPTDRPIQQASLR